MSRDRLETGRLGERLAAEHLLASGWRILARNWRGAAGEIDLVALDGSCLVLVEVRARRSRRFGSAEESLGPAKRRRMGALAQEYVAEAGWEGPWRVDAVALDLGRGGELLRLDHYPDALQP